KQIVPILIAFLLSTAFSCDKQRNDSAIEENKINFDFSKFYNPDSTPDFLKEYIYEAHQCVPIGGMVAINDLDSLFGTPFYCDTTWQTNDWALAEQEFSASKFLPTEPGDTLVMMRRIYGEQGDWIIWIDLEIQGADSLRVLSFIAYDNSEVEM
ncbi:MAG: hypothetical protein K2N16_00900, partial [Muribaculaceae bacterium]|nr:hypothetical protein [Muribaculaceae bacterium]